MLSQKQGKVTYISMKYKSHYTDKLVTEAQYITERICENKVQMKGEELPKQFWNLPEWRVFFVRQHTLANRLLEIYDGAAIIRALKTYAGKKIYSLQAPHLDDLLRKEQRLYEAEQAKLQEAAPVERKSTTEKPRPRQLEKNILSKLGELDGEEEGSGD